MSRNYVKLFPRFLQSEVYRDINCRLVFLHLLLTCSGSGNCGTSIRRLAEETCLTKKQVEVCLRKLQDKGTIRYVKKAEFGEQYKGHSGGQLRSTIKLVHFETYQNMDDVNGTEETDKGTDEGTDGVSVTAVTVGTCDQGSGGKGTVKGTDKGTGKKRKAAEKNGVTGNSLEARAKKAVQWWNENIIPKYPRKAAVRLTKSRLAKLKLRLKEEGWPQALRDCANYLPIPNDDRFTWQPDLDWCITNDSNVFKLIEGKYHDKQTQQQKAANLLEGIFDDE